MLWISLNCIKLCSNQHLRSLQAVSNCYTTCRYIYIYTVYTVEWKMEISHKVLNTVLTSLVSSILQYIQEIWNGCCLRRMNVGRANKKYNTGFYITNDPNDTDILHPSHNVTWKGENGNAKNFGPEGLWGITKQKTCYRDYTIFVDHICMHFCSWNRNVMAVMVMHERASACTCLCFHGGTNIRWQLTENICTCWKILVPCIRKLY